MASTQINVRLGLLLVFIGLVACQDNGIRLKEPQSANHTQVAMFEYSQKRLNEDGTIAWLKGDALAEHLTQQTDYRDKLSNGDYAGMAQLFLRSYRDVFGVIDPGSEFVFQNEQQDDLGYTQVRFAQQFADIPVVDAELRVHFDPSRQLYLINGRYIKSPTNTSIDPKLSLNDIKDQLGKTEDFDSLDDGALVFYAPDSHTVKLAYQLISNAGTLTESEYLIDAVDATVLRRTPRAYNTR